MTFVPWPGEQAGGEASARLPHHRPPAPRETGAIRHGRKRLKVENKSLLVGGRRVDLLEEVQIFFNQTHE